MKYLRYSGEFVSTGRHVYRAEIWQEADAPFQSVGDLTFDADCPIQIEWGEKAKEEVICGSTATIKIESPGDRTYEDMYSIEPGRIRLDVYNDDSLYWSGTIDTEFYEEPYEAADHYIVPVTFSDFGILDRLKYNLSGMLTCSQILTNCLNRCGIKIIFVDQSMISTSLTATGRNMNLSDIEVRSENFYDEDGEASTLAEVIEGMLQPLGLKMIQKSGTIYIFDLNGLHNSTASDMIIWNGETQTLGTDSVYNNAKVTWSTYAQSGNLMPDRCWGMVKTDANLTALETHEGKKKDDATYYSYHAETDASLWSDSTDSGFTIWTSKKGINATLAKGSILEGFTEMRFCKIVPQNDGSEKEGILLHWRTYVSEGGVLVRWHEHGMPINELCTAKGFDVENNFRFIFRTKDVWLPPVEPEDAKGLVLKANMDILADTRFNPYEQVAPLGTLEDEKWKYDVTEKLMNFLYVPVVIKYTSFATGKEYVWDNRNIVKQDRKNPVVLLWPTEGEWLPYSETDGKPNRWGYMVYYDFEDRVNKSGTKGWNSNKPGINVHSDRLSSMLVNANDGMYIPFPDMSISGGKLSISVYGGMWKALNETEALNDNEESNYGGHERIWDNLSWIMCGMPKLEILNKEQYDMEINTDDVEYSATLNKDAKESIDLDTICGTSAEGVPTARGAYFNAATGQQIRTLTREGRTSQAEDLLIGTLYSQYAERHTKLSGETELLTDGLKKYTEQNQGGKYFICVGEVQDLRTETSDATYIELSADVYKNQKGQ